MKNPLKRNNNNKRDKDLNEAKKSETRRKKKSRRDFPFNSLQRLFFFVFQLCAIHQEKSVKSLIRTRE